MFVAGADGTVNAVAIQWDGKVLIGGEFLNVNGVTRTYVARLNAANGNDDGTFVNGLTVGGAVHAIAAMDHGYTLVVGSFTSPRKRIARWAPYQGLTVLDSSFDFGMYGPNDQVKTTAYRSDGTVVIGGLFTEYDADIPLAEKDRGGVARIGGL